MNTDNSQSYFFFYAPVVGNPQAGEANFEREFTKIFVIAKLPWYQVTVTVHGLQFLEWGYPSVPCMIPIKKKLSELDLSKVKFVGSCQETIEKDNLTLWLNVDLRSKCEFLNHLLIEGYIQGNH